MAQSYAKDCKSTVIPGIRYRDCPKAMEWLVDVLGFEKQVVYDGADGTIAHAQLTFGNGMVMVGSMEAGGPAVTVSRKAGGISLLVTDAGAMYDRAKAAGAEIAQELAEMPFGGKAFEIFDPEGHIWWVGEYDAWA